MKISVLGCGSWGTALAMVLAGKGYPVSMWCRRQEQASEMNEKHTNEKYLPGVKLSDNITVTTVLQDAAKDCDYLVLSIPTQSLRGVLQELKGYLNEKTILINTAKGLEVGSNLRLSQVIGEEIPDAAGRFVVLYGPSHAEEVAQGMPTAVVSCSNNQEIACAVQELFMTSYFRVYTNHDVVGSEIGGAIKNIIAIATGALVGVGLGDNAKAALVTRGMAEISRLGIHLGGELQTFSGLTGIGDLMVTCNSQHSRNYRCGYALGQGKNLDQILQDMGMVVEGVMTTKATTELAKSLGIEMPITEMMYRVLFEDFPVKEAVTELMTRDRKSEYSN